MKSLTRQSPRASVAALRITNRRSAETTSNTADPWGQNGVIAMCTQPVCNVLIIGTGYDDNVTTALRCASV